MKTSRRQFGKMLGVSLVAPAVVPEIGLSYIERAELEVEQTGEVSAELTLALLDAQGARGIFTEAEHFEELRRSLARKIRDHKIIREFPVPADIEPLLAFRR